MKIIEVMTVQGKKAFINPMHIVAVGEFAPDRWSVILTKEFAFEISEETKDELVMQINSIR